MDAGQEKPTTSHRLSPHTQGKCYHPFLPSNTSAVARSSGTGPKLIQGPRLLFRAITGSACYTRESKQRASADFFPTSQAKPKALPACAGLSVPPRRQAGGGGRSSVAASLAQAQRERLGADSVGTCRANLERRKDASIGQT